MSQPLRQAVKQIVRGEAETKYTTFYSSFNDGTTAVRDTGFFNQRGWAVHNQAINSNNTDIHQVVPYVVQGTGDNNRIGNKIRVNNLVVNGSVRISIDRLASNFLTNLYAVIYIWQHVSLKDYTNLYANNDFTQFLEDGEGNTRLFQGDPQNVWMRVNSQTYKVYQRKIVPLKFAGITPPLSPTSPFSIANSHVWKADYSCNLTKHMPKLLHYPEVNGVISPPPQTINAPTNSSLCMSIGFVLDNSPADTAATPFTSLPYIQHTYVSQLSFKDM